MLPDDKRKALDSLMSLKKKKKKKFIILVALMHIQPKVMLVRYELAEMVSFCLSIFN